MKVQLRLKSRACTLCVMTTTTTTTTARSLTKSTASHIFFSLETKVTRSEGQHCIHCSMLELRSPQTPYSPIISIFNTEE